MFAQLVGVVSVVTREWANIMNPIINTMGVLTGIVIPLSLYPAAIAEFARLLPVTNGYMAVKAALTGTDFSSVAVPLMREATNALAYLIIGYIGFTVFERLAKRMGTLELEAY